MKSLRLPLIPVWARRAAVGQLEKAEWAVPAVVHRAAALQVVVAAAVAAVAAVKGEWVAKEAGELRIFAVMGLLE